MPNQCEQCWTVYYSTKADLLNQLNNGTLTQEKYDQLLAEAWAALVSCLNQHGCLPPQQLTADPEPANAAWRYGQ